ncbi:Prospero homeobox protein 2 [Clonorchis sinensis]|uniref:Prospero homeobox protein 2 n=1 Tax=Clonorchis sinensis TaxID=79923 RepID=A0A3R7D798_CLOSI|nr:Prospero homeobox protein 2 [Clonorchis sinensis]
MSLSNVQRYCQWLGGQSATNTSHHKLCVNPDLIPAEASEAKIHQSPALSVQSPGLSDSAFIDDGYSSVSSLSTLIQLNREMEDRAFKSTPMRSANFQQSESRDSGLGGSSIWSTSTPSRLNTFWDAFGRHHHHQQQQAFGSPQAPSYFGVTSQLLQKNAPSPSYPHSISASDASFLAALQKMALEKAAQHETFGSANPDASYNDELLSGIVGGISSRDLLRSASRWLQELRYQEVIRKFREEMIGLINNSMSQLELFMKNPTINYPTSTNRSNGDTDCMPLNLKSNTLIGTPEHRMMNFPHTSQTSPQQPAEDIRMTPLMDRNSLQNRIPTNSVEKIRSPHKSANQMVTKLKSSAGKHRRSRIRAGSRRLRVRQTKSHEIHYDATQYTGKDGTLDLRMRQAAIESASENHLEGVRERVMILSASHLKRAKMMFLYARYPNSSMLKSHFPDVIFTRATTAQMVKWFSNFREFFYIQIEKWARQCNANRCPVELAVKITRGHELFQCLEGHYNRDQELPTPEDFLVVTQIAVQEFVEAVVNRKDRDPTWKKNIYKTVALLDKPFPDFLKFLK